MRAMMGGVNGRNSHSGETCPIIPYMSAMDGPQNRDLDALSTLAWLVEAGADEAVLDAPVNRILAEKAQNRLAAGAMQAPPKSAEPAPRPMVPRPSSTAQIPNPDKAAPAGAYTDQIAQALEIASRCQSLDELRAALEAFDGGALKRNSTHTVFADGQRDARIMFIGEAPGRDEDRAGLPFVGKAGKLLDRMLAPIGLERSLNFYITNVLPWQPPGNRDFGLEEAAMCLPFLRRHIELKKPDLLVLLGRIAVKNVLGKTDGIMSLRGKWFDYFVEGRNIPALCTLHPAYLLRRPVDKKLAWRDMQSLELKARELDLL